MRVNDIVALSDVVLHRVLFETNNQVGWVSCEGLVTAAGEDETSLLAEAWHDDHIEALRTDYIALGLAEHRLARNIDLLHSTIEELEELAFESHIDIWLSVPTIDLFKLGATCRTT